MVKHCTFKAFHLLISVPLSTNPTESTVKENSVSKSHWEQKNRPGDCNKEKIQQHLEARKYRRRSQKSFASSFSRRKSRESEAADSSEAYGWKEEDELEVWKRCCKTPSTTLRAGKKKKKVVRIREEDGGVLGGTAGIRWRW